MSSEIFYDKAFILADGRYIPIVNHGSSNCFDFDSRGREIPERYWSVLSYPFHGRLIFTAEEIKQIAAAHETANTENRGGTLKSRNRAFEVGEFGRWILAGLNSAHTVEEYRNFGNSVIIIDYDRNWSKASVASTVELLDILERRRGENISVSFADNRHICRPIKAQKGYTCDFSNLDRYYILRSEQGVFVKRSRRRIWLTRSEQSVPVRKFKTEAEAQKYLQDNHAFLSACKCVFHMECVENKEGTK